MSRQAWLLVAISGLYVGATALSNTFVNAYLWKLEREFATLGWFNLAQSVAMGLAFVTAGYLTNRCDRVWALRMGMLAHVAFYLTVLQLERHAPAYALPLGLLLGMGMGFFWFGYNVILFDVTDPENRDRFNGTNGLVMSAMGIVAPLVGGWLIGRETFAGYRWVFGLSLCIFALATVLSGLLRPRADADGFHLRPVWRASWLRHTRWHAVMVAMLLEGLREGVFAFLVGVLVVVATGSEWRLGLYATLSSLVSLASYGVVGRFVKPHRRRQAALVGSLLATASVLPLLAEVSFATLVVLGVGTAIAYPLFIVPVTSTAFDVIGAAPHAVRDRTEYVVMRELALNVGRVLSVAGFLLLVAWRETLTLLAAYLALTSSALVGAALWMGRSEPEWKAKE